ncbi:uncharacterized protein V6R79_019396 [Siganus canaliculatus]
MDECEDNTLVLQQGEEQQPSDLTVLIPGSPDPSQGQDDPSSNEWDTDLETDDAPKPKQSLSRSERTSLSLSHYGEGPLAAKALTKALQVQTLIYLYNLSNKQAHVEGTRIVSEMLNNYNMTTIKLSGNQQNLFTHKLFSGDYMVKELDLSHNKFTDDAGEHLGKMLATNVGIEVLNLSWNHLRRRGAVALCAGLKENSTLKKLLLSHNGFGRVGAESLGRALKENQSVELLDLSSNHIDDQAVALLCHGLSTNSTLRILKLSVNILTNVGALTLLRMVGNNVNSAVEEIDISTVYVYEAFLELLREIRQSRPALTVHCRILSSVSRIVSAPDIFKKFLEERHGSITDFFQALDKEGAMTVSTSAFREAVKAANIPLDKQQVEWLVKKLDKNCTATIFYSELGELQ